MVPDIFTQVHVKLLLLIPAGEGIGRDLIKGKEKCCTFNIFFIIILLFQKLKLIPKPIPLNHLFLFSELFSPGKTLSFFQLSKTGKINIGPICVSFICFNNEKLRITEWPKNLLDVFLYDCAP